MITASGAGAFDAWGSQLIAAGAAVAAVLIAQWFIERGRRRDARVQAADALSIEISNVRDAAVRSKDGRRGKFDLWPMRNQLILSRRWWGGLNSIAECEAFYRAASNLRVWLRENPEGYVEPIDVTWTDAQTSSLDQYWRRLDAYADWLIDLLRLSPDGSKQPDLNQPIIPPLPET